MLRFASLLVTLSLGTVLAQEPDARELNEAQVLFEAMEAKLLGAKTLDVRYTLEASRGEQTMRVTGRLRFGPEQARCEAEAQREGAPQGVMLLVLSGNRFVSSRTQGEQQAEAPQSKKAPGGAAASMRAAMARASLMLPQAMGDLGFKAFEVEGFELGAKLEQDDRSLQAIKFEATVENDVLSIELWVDLATQLPVKRRVVGKRGNAISETFDSIELDVEFPPNTFVVPGTEKPAPVLDPEDMDPEPAPLPGK